MVMILVSVVPVLGTSVPKSISRSLMENEKVLKVSWIYWKPDLTMNPAESYWPGAF